MAIARTAARVLLCMAFSQAGAHEEALRVAREAVEITDSVLPGFAEDTQRPNSAMAQSMAGTGTSSGEEGMDIEVTKYNKATKQLLLERIAQLAVQARQCQALETEFINQDAADSEELAELHSQGLLIANQYLPRRNTVRIQATKAHREWQMRSTGITDESLWPFNAQGVARGPAMQVWRNHLSQSRPHTTKSEAGIGLSKHERLYQGIPPQVDVREQRRRGLLSSQLLREHRPDSGIRTLSGQAAQFSLDSAPSEASMVYDEDEGAAGGRELERALTAPHAGLENVSQDRLTTIKTGDLYTGSSPHSREPQRSASGGAIRRTPVLFSMMGAGGKAAWALRRAGKKRLQDDTHRINAFEDWTKNASGPKVNLKDQILQTETGIQHFQSELKRSSDKFKHFWLKDEVTADDLWQDRTIYCGEGLRVLRKSKPPKTPTPATPKAQKLFKDYGMTCPNSPDLSVVYQELSTYGSLLSKSQETLNKLMPNKRGTREEKYHKEESGKFASLKGLGGLLSFGG